MQSGCHHAENLSSHSGRRTQADTPVESVKPSREVRRRSVKSWFRADMCAIVIVVKVRVLVAPIIDAPVGNNLS